MPETFHPSDSHLDLSGIVARIPAFDRTAAQAARDRWANRAKPPGSLGLLEDVATTVAGVTGQCPPEAIDHPAVAVFAGDHGVVADGASAWPSEVTGLMVDTMAAGAAAVSALSRTVGASILVVDVGVASDVEVPGVLHAKVRPGTASLARGPAMTIDEARRAVGVGVAVAERSILGGADLLVGGEMGIGNTTSSAALIAWATGADAHSVTGPGAGLAEVAMATKVACIEAGLARARTIQDPLEALAEIGGLEIAALVGFQLGALSNRVPVLIDGVIALAALCVTDRLAPGAAAAVLAGHRSTEPAASIALDHLGLDPLLDLRLRLGEGTGAVLAVPIVRAAVDALRTMAELPPADVS